LFSPVCGKHISILKDSFTDEEEEFTPDTSFSFKFSSEITIPILTSAVNPFISTGQSKSSTAELKSQPRIKADKAMKHPFAATDGDIAMFKRVILKTYNE
jgi:hypothetical protein